MSRPLLLTAQSAFFNNFINITWKKAQTYGFLKLQARALSTCASWLQLT